MTTKLNNNNGVKGEPRVTRINAVNLPNRPSLLGFANIVYEGKIFMSNIAVRENKEGDAFLSFPSKKRVNNGQDVLDQNGRPIYDDYFGCADKTTREHVEKLIFDAVQDALDGVQKPLPPKGEEKAIVHLVKNPSAGAIAMASVVATGKFFLTGLTINQVGEGDAFLGYPSRRRMKNGQQVVGENGRPIYDDYFGPGSKEDKEKMEDMIFSAFEKICSEEETSSSQEPASQPE